MGRSFMEHDFYCINCGNKGISIMRNQGHKQSKLHRKKLYCIHCKTEVNHIECKSPDEVATFKKEFERGKYVKEAKESLSHVGSLRIG